MTPNRIHIRGPRPSGQFALCGMIMGSCAHEMVASQAGATCEACIAAWNGVPGAADAVIDLAVDPLIADYYIAARKAGLGTRAQRDAADRRLADAGTRLSAVLAAARAVASVDLAFAGAMQVAIAALRSALAAADAAIAPEKP